jgi:hypothetical protein
MGRLHWRWKATTDDVQMVAANWDSQEPPTLAAPVRRRIAPRPRRARPRHPAAGFAIEPAPARRAATVSGFKPSSAKAASEWAAAAAKASAKTRQSNPASFSAASLHNRSSGYRSDNAATSTKSRAAARPNNARVWSAAT